MRRTVSCIITFHREGLLAHTTLSSIECARKFAESQGYIVEFSITIDLGDSLTERVVRNHPGIRKTDPIENVTYGDLGNSRNHAIEMSIGEMIICFDGDDYYSNNYIAAYAHTIHENRRHIAMPEYIFRFGNIYTIQKNTHLIPASPYTLLSAHPYCPSIGARRYVFEKVKFQKMSAGFGFEDWHWNCEAAAAGFLHKIAPETVYFYRRKNSSMSLCARYKQQNAVIPSSKLFKLLPSPVPELERQDGASDASPESIPVGPQAVSHIPSMSMTWKYVVKFMLLAALRKLPLPMGNKLYNILRHLKTAKRFQVRPAKKFDPAILQALQDAARIDGLLHPDHLPPVTTYVPFYNESPGQVYARAWQILPRHDYDIVYTVPHLATGGADLMARNYIRCACSAGKRILCLTTSPGLTDTSALPQQVDVLLLGKLIESLPAEQQQLIISRLLLELAPKTLHVVNDRWTFPCLVKHGPALASAGRIIASIYTETHEDDYDLCWGAATINLRAFYPHVAKIVTDNAINQNEWIKRFGLPESFFNPVYGLIDSIKEECVTPPERNRILWAGRFDQQKRLDIVLSIAEAMPDIHFDIYGAPVLDNSHPALGRLRRLSNVSLPGSYDGFSSLPTEQYFAYLYTTQYDGLPNALLEATAAGLPVVAPDRGGIRDFITPETGLLLPSHTDTFMYVRALREIQEHPEEAAARWRKARKIVMDRHNAEAFRRSLFAAYDW